MLNRVNDPMEHKVHFIVAALGRDCDEFTMSDAHLRAWYERSGFRSAESPDLPNLMRRDFKA
jgi:hypothetical protein